MDQQKKIGAKFKIYYTIFGHIFWIHSLLLFTWAHAPCPQTNRARLWIYRKKNLKPIGQWTTIIHRERKMLKIVSWFTLQKSEKKDFQTSQQKNDHLYMIYTTWNLFKNLFKFNWFVIGIHHHHHHNRSTSFFRG